MGRVWSRLNLPRAAVGDPRRGGVWLGFLHGGVVHFGDGRSPREHGQADGLAAGPNQRSSFRSLTARCGSPRRRAQPAERRPPGDVDVGQRAAVRRRPMGHSKTRRVRFGWRCRAGWCVSPAAEIDARGYRSGSTGPTVSAVSVDVFGNSDGFRSSASRSAYSRAGREVGRRQALVSCAVGVSVLDPGFLPFNTRAAAGAHRSDHRGPQDLRAGRVDRRSAPAAADARPADRLHGAQSGRAGKESVSLQAGRPGHRLAGRRQLGGRRSIPISPRDIPLSRHRQQQRAASGTRRAPASTSRLHRRITRPRGSWRSSPACC